MEGIQDFRDEFNQNLSAMISPLVNAEDRKQNEMPLAGPYSNNLQQNDQFLLPSDRMQNPDLYDNFVSPPLLVNGSGIDQDMISN